MAGWRPRRQNKKMRQNFKWGGVAQFGSTSERPLVYCSIVLAGVLLISGYCFKKKKSEYSQQKFKSGASNIGCWILTKVIFSILVGLTIIITICGVNMVSFILLRQTHAVRIQQHSISVKGELGLKLGFVSHDVCWITGPKAEKVCGVDLTTVTVTGKRDVVMVRRSSAVSLHVVIPQMQPH